MPITPYQILLASVALYVIIQRTLRFFRRDEAQSILKYLTIVLVWGMIGAVSLFPSIAHFIRKTFGFGDNFNTMIFLAFVVLFVLFFRILAVIEKIESQLTEIIRKEALGQNRRNPRRKEK